MKVSTSRLVQGFSLMMASSIGTMIFWHAQYSSLFSDTRSTSVDQLTSFIHSPPVAQSAFVDIPLSVEPVPRPPLDSLVSFGKEWQILDDVRWLLNVAVVGFPKCGTSTLMHHLEAHPEVKMFTEERCDLGGGQAAKLVEDLYNMPLNATIRGLKCPQDLESLGMALPEYVTHFPETRMIVGVRHPVLWFESFYNCTCIDDPASV